jgi:hypothetical protein
MFADVFCVSYCLNYPKDLSISFTKSGEQTEAFEFQIECELEYAKSYHASVLHRLENPTTIMSDFAPGILAAHKNKYKAVPKDQNEWANGFATPLAPCLL